MKISKMPFRLVRRLRRVSPINFLHDPFCPSGVGTVYEDPKELIPDTPCPLL